jgi:hypothetical protein
MQHRPHAPGIECHQESLDGGDHMDAINIFREVIHVQEMRFHAIPQGFARLASFPVYRMPLVGWLESFRVRLGISG